MLRAKDIHDQLVRGAAKRRLGELDAERDILMQILNGTRPPRKVKRRGQSKNHWTQTPQGRAKMSRLMKAKYASGWKAQMRRGHAGPQPTAEQQLESALPETDQSTH